MFFGTVKTWLPERGFGFIKSDDQAQRGDVFVHATSLLASGITNLEIGARVSFDVEADKRDPTRIQSD